MKRRDFTKLLVEEFKGKKTVVEDALEGWYLQGDNVFLCEGECRHLHFYFKDDGDPLIFKIQQLANLHNEVVSEVDCGFMEIICES